MVGLSDLLNAMNISRRQFLIGSSVSALALGLGKYWGAWFPVRPIKGEILGASTSMGHKLRGVTMPEPTETIQKDVVIIGGGIAGLAAGYRLKKAGFEDYLILDLDKQVGGNSQSGKNEVSAYPWGAHYIPLPTQDAKAVKSLFEELDVITGYDENGLPILNEFYICADPHERLFIHGRWQDGLIPSLGASPNDDEQYNKFFELMKEYKSRIGKDGKRAFAIPIDYSSSDDDLIALDNITMIDWMKSQGFISEYLLWYVDYCCRDDYGTVLGETSAWAGIHYFAARSGQASNAEPQNVLTWPEGNGWIVQKLENFSKEKIRTQTLVYNVTDADDQVIVEFWDDVKKSSVRIECKSAILCTPHFISARILKSNKVSLSANDFSYSPWAVFNITLDKLPEGKGAQLSWDNVIYKSPFLGYVIATNQIPQMKPIKTVMTYYWPLSHLPPAQARQEALERSYDEWQEIILSELLKVHPELHGFINQLDVWVWGHAMVRPTKGFIWGEARQNALKQKPPIFTAHSDMSGISIFEEAYTHGIRAAENALGYLNIKYETFL